MTDTVLASFDLDNARLHTIAYRMCFMAYSWTV